MLFTKKASLFENKYYERSLLKDNITLKIGDGLISIEINKKMNQKDIELLFSSVGWEKQKDWNRIHISIQNSETVITAWNNDELIGLVNAFSDKTSVVYLHYVLVHKKYQNQGIGKLLISQIKSRYNDFQHFILISCNESISFFKHCGFFESQATVMEIRKK